MLIKIDNSVVANLESRSQVERTEVIQCLRFLAFARQEGKHIVIADRKTLDFIISCLDDDNLTKKIYDKILKTEVAYMESYRSAVSRHIEVCYPCPEPESSTINNKEIIRVPPSFFDDTATIQGTIILGENLNDSKFYELISKVYKVKKNLNLPISCECRGGGGDTISVALSNIEQKNERFCLCIVDSDRKAPESTLGQTAKAIKKAHNSNRHRTELYILNVREIENLIPTSILAELSLNPSQQESLKLIELIDISSVQQTRKFLDLKKGTLLSDIIKTGEDEVKSFWQDKILRIPNIQESLCQECYDKWNCQNNNCSCKIFCGFGGKILDNVIELPQMSNPHEIARKITASDPLYSEWEEIGQRVINWCLAKPRISAL